MAEAGVNMKNDIGKFEAFSELSAELVMWISERSHSNTRELYVQSFQGNMCGHL